MPNAGSLKRTLLPANTRRTTTADRPRTATTRRRTTNGPTCVVAEPLCTKAACPPCPTAPGHRMTTEVGASVVECRNVARQRKRGIDPLRQLIELGLKTLIRLLILLLKLAELLLGLQLGSHNPEVIERRVVPTIR